MITFSLVNILTIVAYTALATDISLEIKKVLTRKHSADISAIGTAIRAGAALIIMWKLLVVGDMFLIVGHMAMVVLICFYFSLVFRYRNAL